MSVGVIQDQKAKAQVSTCHTYTGLLCLSVFICIRMKKGEDQRVKMSH
jgi:hypothetical protein